MVKEALEWAVATVQFPLLSLGVVESGIMILERSRLRD
jgi:hypothetical protein